jgi:hypothetical protein
VGQVPVGDEILIKALGLNLSLFSKGMGFCFMPYDLQLAMEDIPVGGAICQLNEPEEGRC